MSERYVASLSARVLTCQSSYIGDVSTCCVSEFMSAITQPFAEVYEAHIMYDVNKLRLHRKYYGRLDRINVKAQQHQRKQRKSISSGYIFPKIIWEAQSVSKRTYKTLYECMRRYVTV